MTVATGTNDLVLAAIVGVPALIATLVPVILARLAAKAKLEEKLIDDQIAYKRAREAQEATERADASALEAARLFKISTAKADERAVVVDMKLDMLHQQGNSNLTAVMRSERNATARELTMMRELIALKEATGHAPIAVDALHALQGKLNELDAAIALREEEAKTAALPLAEIAVAAVAAKLKETP